MSLDTFLKEIEELKTYKTKYSCLLEKYNHRVVELYIRELDKWEATLLKDHQKKYTEKWCKNCRHFGSIEKECRKLCGDILKPVLKENAEGEMYLSYVDCDNFEWE